jgi:hypothetical protein
MTPLIARITGTPARRLATPAEELRGLSRRGLSDLQRFILVSAAVFMVRDFNLYEAFPEEVLQILGCAPPPQLVLIALAGYVFTVVTPLLIHLCQGDKPAVSHWHLLYRSIFYLFFLCSQTLDAYFMLVLGIGLLLYLLEQTCVGVSIHRLNHGNGHPA